HSDLCLHQASTKQIMLKPQSWFIVPSLLVWVMALNSADGRILTVSDLLQLVGEIQSLETDVPRPSKRGACSINGGLSHGCDYKDLVGAMNEKAYWAGINPGRKRSGKEAGAPSETSIPLRKRSGLCNINAGMSTGCDAYDLVEALNEKDFLTGLNPGKKRSGPAGAAARGIKTHP
ncbi:unnamed protein product, partial [Meganyctiphanes norvegica]